MDAYPSRDSSLEGLLACMYKASDAPGETLEMTSPEINSQQREDPFSRRVSSSASSGPYRDLKSSLESTVPSQILAAER